MLKDGVIIVRTGVGTPSVGFRGEVTYTPYRGEDLNQVVSALTVKGLGLVFNDGAVLVYHHQDILVEIRCLEFGVSIEGLL